MKPFNLKDALEGKPVITRDGQKIKDLYLMKNTNHYYPLVVCVSDNNGSDRITVMTKEGKNNFDHDIKSIDDLFMAPTKKKLWIGIDPNDQYGNNTTGAYSSKESLIANVMRHDRFKIIEIEIEE